MSKETGGDAFPNKTESNLYAGTFYYERGMTLRDYFAAHAPECPKWFYEITRSGNEIADQRCVALWRYSYADAMIKERSK